MSVYSADLSIIVEAYNDHDVLCGRGGAVNSHIGNFTFRHLIHLNKNKYFFSKREKKAEIALSLVKAIRNQDPPGRFLKQDSESGLWFDVGDVKAVEKTRQALRENLSKRSKSANDSDKDISADQFEIIENLFSSSGNSKNFVPYFPKQENKLKIQKIRSREYYEEDDMLSKDRTEQSLTQSHCSILERQRKNKATSFTLSNLEASYASAKNINDVIKDLLYLDATKSAKPTEKRSCPCDEFSEWYLMNNEKDQVNENDDYLAQTIVDASFSRELSEQVNDDEIDKLIIQTFANESLISNNQQTRTRKYFPNESKSIGTCQGKFNKLLDNQKLECSMNILYEQPRKKLRQCLEQDNFTTMNAVMDNDIQYTDEGLFLRKWHGNSSA